MLFASKNSRYTFKVVPFGPMNALVFYTCMMQYFHVKWHILSIVTFCIMDKIGGRKVVVTETYDILVVDIKVHSSIKGFLDDILIRSTNLELVLIYFEYVYKVFDKYRVISNIKKC